MAGRRNLTGILLGIWALGVGIGLFIYFGLPDATPSRLRQECRDLLQKKVYMTLMDRVLKMRAAGESDSLSEVEITLEITSANELDLNCPGAIHNLTVDNGNIGYLVFPNLDGIARLDQFESVILACDRPGSHPVGSEEWANFLLGDGRVVMCRVDSTEFGKWTERFSAPGTSPVSFPPADLKVEY